MVKSISLLTQRNSEYKALFFLFSLSLVTMGTLAFVNLSLGLVQLFAIEIASSLFSLVALYRMLYKEVIFQRYALTFIFMLMAVLLMAVMKVPSTARAVVFVFFFPFASVILLEKRLAWIMTSIFILVIYLMISLHLTAVHFTSVESISLLFSLIVFSLLAGFYVYAVKEADRIIEIKENSLKENEERFKMVTDIAFEALIITKNGIIIQGNDKAVEMFGYSTQADILNEHLRKFVTPQSMQKIAIHVKNNDESAYIIEGFKKDGTTFPSRVRGKNVIYGGQAYRVSAIEDITNLQEAKDQITKLASAVEQSSQTIFITDIDGKIEYVNRSFEEKTGFTSAEAIGKTPRIFRSYQHGTDFYREMWSTLKSGKSWKGEMFNHRKDGSSFIVQNFINSIKNEKGEITHFISTQEDVTQQKEQEKVLLSQMKQAQMGEMLSMIAHQWRQPLNAISAVSASIQLGLEFDDINKDDVNIQLATIDDQVQFLSETINDFKNFFQPDKGKNLMSTSVLFHKVLLILEKQLEIHDIQVRIINESNPEIFTFMNELVQVILSLLNNVIDKVIDDGLSHQYIDIEVFDSGDTVIITVQDYAGGIPEEIISEIFMPYFSTKKEKQGTGLGLYMCKTIIEEHCGGMIYAENKNNGAQFIIELPKKEDSPSQL